MLPRLAELIILMWSEGFRSIRL